MAIPRLDRRERGPKVMNVHLFVLSPAERERGPRHLAAIPRAIEWCRLIYWTWLATVDAMMMALC